MSSLKESFAHSLFRFDVIILTAFCFHHFHHHQVSLQLSFLHLIIFQASCWKKPQTVLLHCKCNECKIKQKMVCLSPCSLRNYQHQISILILNANKNINVLQKSTAFNMFADMTKVAVVKFWFCFCFYLESFNVPLCSTGFAFGFILTHRLSAS